MTSTRGARLAADLASFNVDMKALIEECPDAAWQARTGDEEWTVAAVASHVAQGHYAVLGLAKLAAAGQTLPELTWEGIHHGNAEHAAQHEACSKTDALQMLEENGSAAVEFARNATDEQLAGTAYIGLLDRELSAEDILRVFVLQAAQGHVKSMQETIAGYAQSETRK